MQNNFEKKLNFDQFFDVKINDDEQEKFNSNEPVAEKNNHMIDKNVMIEDETFFEVNIAQMKNKMIINWFTAQHQFVGVRADLNWTKLVVE